ncbi:FG-GAP repeat domain-containing protein [Pelagicoccus mobilis]|uniref:VCBS repeat-containing protein n=1 Tax=Pelagicoccus mobilis TaxID=415221 RepID=A0A934RV60_9BACT|nr:VCBS repeat-containing protein [Pelagicoccus mobilis]MBK1878260.1 VCBS repeat-containing protein [Pelagicoccus mobilis]
MKSKRIPTTAFRIATVLGLSAYSALSAKPLDFSSVTAADDVQWWWAVTVADVTNDGIQDIVYINNNAQGGHLGYRIGQTTPGLWEKVIVAETPPTGGEFASGDLETGDFDGDGDIDLIGVKHTGEWDDAKETAEIFWYENPSWTPRPIGDCLGAVKDLSTGDFNNDGLLDLAVLNFNNSQLRVYQQNQDKSFSIVYDTKQRGLHEGMDVGDIDGDGYPDIAANGYAFFSPGKSRKGWSVELIDERWVNQDGDWSQNATKNVCVDIDGDGLDEVFISHSERSGYPIAWYDRNEKGSWTINTVLNELSSCHTLQVYDMDLDGDLDVVAGINKDRAWNLKLREFPVLVMLNDGSGKKWEKNVITEGGIYNGRVADFEGDGDFDLFRLNGHEAKSIEVLVNQVK